MAQAVTLQLPIGRPPLCDAAVRPTCMVAEAQLKCRPFAAQELILFSRADLERSIPSMVDGFKPGQRKIMFSCFKRNLKKDIKVWRPVLSLRSACTHIGYDPNRHS